MFSKILKIIQIKELRNKILYVLGLMIVFRLAAVLPVPGVDTDQLRAFFENNQLFGLLNLFSGGGLSNLSIVMLGVGPYITASIIMQLLTMIFPSVKEMYHEGGEAGRQKFNQYSRILTVPLALLQGYGMLKLFQNQGVLDPMSSQAMIYTLIVITAGTVFLMWLGELMTEQGIGNGISLIIFAGIVAQIPETVIAKLGLMDASQIPGYAVFLVLAVLVVASVVLANEAQRNLPVSYAKRVRGGKMYGGVNTYLPLKVNSAGMIPIIFAMSIMLFPGMIGSFLVTSSHPTVASAAAYIVELFNNQTFYGSMYFIFVVLFTFFYTAVVFEPHTVSGNLQKQGGFIPGIRPGNPTKEYLSYVINRITLAGAIFLGLIAVLPFIGQVITHDNSLVLGGAAVLIVVGVVLDTVRQIEAQIITKDYEQY
ncbi:preprotein translocase subunit SecY [Patescibacteria group bacterium]|nr:preprotein translocase subunit SecY [Patescibacteria group bacterium]MBU4142336.1 preprotein translocase subunit SecY [Patescibacteria group bacterium]